MANRLETFSTRLLDWFDLHGRHDLPWQQQITPYRVWVSEIMLQQTQVSTVIGYFQRFMERFPELSALAAASEDEVLHYWSGLGYYARGRNLLRTARLICERWQGHFPTTTEELMRLPGIGRSTAGAIASIALGQRAPILDGNVKRVLCRIEAVDASPYEKTTNDRLWALADYLTPTLRTADYTQAIMDLGATVCSRAKPRCLACPMVDLCKANEIGRPQDYPVPKPRKQIPIRQCQMLVIRNADGETLLEKRPISGIWGGLWSLPQLSMDESPITACEQRGARAIEAIEQGTAFRHTFTHYHLDIQPIYVQVLHWETCIHENDKVRWHRAGKYDMGLAAPIKKLLDQSSATQLTLPTETL